MNDTMHRPAGDAAQRREAGSTSRTTDWTPVGFPHGSTGVTPEACFQRDTAKSRPLRKVSAGGARATKAVAINGPKPGIVISRRATSFIFARRAISASRLLIWSSLLSDNRPVQHCQPSWPVTPTGDRAYLRSTLEAIAAGHPQHRIDEFLPWNFQPTS